MAQYGPHRWSAGWHDDGRNAEFRGARFLVKDFAGARFTDCDLTGVKIVDAALVDVDISGYVSNVVINGVDVTAYVSDELDTRHPERVQLRSMRDADDFRAMWATIGRLWSSDQVPEDSVFERVDEEWSYAETLRHLVFITDCWASRTILDVELPYHRLALPQTAYDPADAAMLGIDLGARPSYAEILAARADRMQVVTGILDGLTDDDLGRECPRSPAPGYPEGPRPVWECLAVLMEEEIEHHRYAMRDLAVLRDRGGQRLAVEDRE